MNASTIKTKLVPIGEAQGIVLADELLEKLGFTRDSELEISIDGDRLILAKAGRARPVVVASRPPIPPREPAPPRKPAPPARKPPSYGFPKKQPW
jgi:hypothetical protein